MSRATKPGSFQPPNIAFGCEFLESRLLLASTPVPTAPSLVSISAGDRRVFVRDRLSDGTLSQPDALVMRGVNWSPASVGTDPAKLTDEYALWYRTDIPLMAKMGVNVVRLYGFQTTPDAFKILDEFYRYGIKVIVTVDSPRQGVVADTANISAVVSAYKNHPAILAWAVGNEWDLNNQGAGFYFGKFATLEDSAHFIQQSAELIKSIDTAHPVTTFMADPHIPGVHPLDPEEFPYATGRPYTSEIVQTLVPSVDLWGFNVYRNSSFGNLFQMWEEISDKPMFVSEFGADSFDHRISGENESMQADFDAGLWDEIDVNLSAERTNGAAVGGLAFEFNDEWWKNGDPSSQDVSNEFNPGQPDGHNDEEHFGLVDIHRTPKQSFGVMQARFMAGSAAVALNANPIVRAISQGTGVGNSGAEFFIDDDSVYRRPGGAFGGRGVNVAVLDEHTGIRMSDTRTFDTWLSAGGFGGPHENFPPLIDYLNGLPNGSIILLAIGDEGGFINPNTNQPWNDVNVQQAYATLESLGSRRIREVGYRGGWAMIVRKGFGVLAEDASAPNVPAEAQAQVSLDLDGDAGRRPGPIVRSAEFRSAGGGAHSLVVRFSEDVQGTLSPTDLRIVHRETGESVPAGVMALSTYDGATNTATFAFPGYPGGTLPSGDYRATIVAAGIADAGGDPVATDYVLRFAVAGVVGRRVFYNNSRFDGHDASANLLDDDAVAPDKRGLPAGDQPSFANVTSYIRGINGVMVDVVDMPNSIGADDLSFRMSAGSSLSVWTPAPAPSDVVLRRGTGDEDSDRLTITWPDGSIVNRWLEVTIPANADTGLAVPDVFYVGNLIGETGDPGVVATVNAVDLVRTRNTLGTGLATIDSRFDFDRSGAVDAADLVLSRNNGGRSLALGAASPGLAFPDHPPAGDRSPFSLNARMFSWTPIRRRSLLSLAVSGEEPTT